MRLPNDSFLGFDIKSISKEKVPVIQMLQLLTSPWRRATFHSDPTMAYYSTESCASRN
jgi:hypothetical protein